MPGGRGLVGVVLRASISSYRRRRAAPTRPMARCEGSPSDDTGSCTIPVSPSSSGLIA